ncbi:hypothetical protein pqer_cds_215 [Pandoravirus quercus]|uniref:Uncharacterized protein n=2 Tax=Pandoravirus TaxID=2060084 RepID=A0A2U7U883_9VIRU|nr:hypothetical protein pqer_cds_215 [Pandoravirus quercus]AVK74637.1 hypothetical protein pqer_cds_215 [Pandoravirus quercus]QBZ80815.1 hypothetical protein pclt_cds_217 [Pandoravirus celtis]
MEATDEPRDPDASTAQTLDDGRLTDADLIEQALSCVAWDESVDLARLLVLEHAYNRAILTNTVAKAARRLDRNCGDRSLAIYAMGSKGETDRGHVYGERVQGAWCIGDAAITMTDTELVDYLTVCARSIDFSVFYWIRQGDEGFFADRTPQYDPTEKPNFTHTWMACLTTALARQKGAWTGIDIMRTHNLCVALLKIIDTRTHAGPLALVDVPKCVAPLDQSAIPRDAIGLALTDAHDTPRMDAAHQDTPTELARSGAVAWRGAASIGDVLKSMRQGLEQVALLRRKGMDFNVAQDRVCIWPTPCSLRTRDVLDALYCSTERLYATEPYFCKMIAPAEYKAMAEGAPFGSTFYR